MIFNRFYIYTVHMKLRDGKPTDQIELVQEGFCLWAFVFTALWALYHRLWYFALILIGLNVGVVLADKYLALGEVSTMFLQLGVSVWTGFNAHDYKRARLKKLGYVFSDMVSGESRMRAEQRYLDRHGELLAAIA